MLPKHSNSAASENASAKKLILPWEEENPIEPLPVPRKSLYWLAGLCGVLALSVFVPVEDQLFGGGSLFPDWLSGSLLGICGDALYDGLFVGAVFFFAYLLPAVTSLLAMLMALSLARSASLLFVSRKIHRLTRMVLILAMAWIVVAFFVLGSAVVKMYPVLDLGIIMLGILSIALLPAGVAFFLRSHHSGQGAISLILVGSVNLALTGLIYVYRLISIRLDPYIVIGLFIPVALAIIILGFRVLFVYRRQWRLEQAFERVMRERER